MKALKMKKLKTGFSRLIVPALAVFLLGVFSLCAVSAYADDKNQSRKNHKEYRHGKDYDEDRHRKDHDEDRHRNDNDEYRHRKKHGFFSTMFASRKMPVVDHANTKEECSDCHWAYLPGLLPERSWKAILAKPNDHFGEEIELSRAVQQDIAGYLSKYAADRIESRYSMKILNSIDPNDTPLRISKNRYIVKKHDDIGPSILKRESIGGLNNCIACHQQVDKTGKFSEHDVEIPEK
ncbi:MAG: hypothetical protein GY866_03995 [Proteobacteria bacterium]|nr:hypothetical protein [Pseudomonadota bacterium]